MIIQTINPTTETILQEYPLISKGQMVDFIEAAHSAFEDWRHVAFSIRRKKMFQLSQLLQQQKEMLAQLIAEEMGKPITQGQAEIEKCAWVCEHYAENAEKYLKSRTINTEKKKTTVYYQPLGVVLSIMPWNFPFWQVFRFAVPTIMAGNTILLKHAPNSMGCAMKITKLFKEANFPSHVFQHLIIDTKMAAEVIANHRIVAVTLTGSREAGSAVASNAAKHLKKAVLELGGNDPYVILHDANLEEAAKAIVDSRLNNCGQVCIAAKRIIAVETIHDALVEKIVKLIGRYTMGNPLDQKTTMGPMARQDLREHLHKQVQDTIQMGAELVTGGVIPQKKGFYYPPTILLNVRQGMTAFEEELFGPVIAVTRANDENEAIRLANQSQYALGAAVFTKDLTRGEHIAKNEIEAGMCFVNSLVASDPRVPFGGIKSSGFGRELSTEGIREFVNVKTVSIK